MTRIAVLACLLLGTSAAQAGPVIAGLTYLDGGEPRTVRRLGARDARGRERVELMHPRTGAPIAATVGAEALVQLDGDDPAVLAAARLVSLRVVAPALRVWLVRSAGREDGLDVAARLAAHPAPGIVGAIPDLAFPHVRATRAFVPPPDDPRYPDQWFWPRIDMAGAWARETGTASTTIVVIDDGCDLAHPDLVEQLDAGKDTFSNDDDPSYVPGAAGNNHGTACAGLVGARTNNALGVAGACPGCRLRCVRLLGQDGEPVPVSADMNAFQFAADVGAAVLSNSWGFKQSVPVPDLIRQQLEALHDGGRGGKGAVVVFAAGNDDRELADDEINAVRGVVTVGADNNFGELTSFSNHGPSVDLVAPTGTFTTDISGSDGSDPGDYVSTFGGTSSACPIVAGIVGLLVSAAPERTAAQIVDALLKSAHQSPFATPDATGHDDYYGLGEVRPMDALRLLAGEVLDMGAPDAAMEPPTMDDPGCGCSVGHRVSATGWLILPPLLLIRRRRKEQATGDRQQATGT